MKFLLRFSPVSAYGTRMTRILWVEPRKEIRVLRGNPRPTWVHFNLGEKPDKRMI